MASTLHLLNVCSVLALDSVPALLTQGYFHCNSLLLQNLLALKSEIDINCSSDSGKIRRQVSYPIGKTLLQQYRYNIIETVKDQIGHITHQHPICIDSPTTPSSAHDIYASTDISPAGLLHIYRKVQSRYLMQVHTFFLPVPEAVRSIGKMLCQPLRCRY